MHVIFRIGARLYTMLVVNAFRYVAPLSFRLPVIGDARLRSALWSDDCSTVAVVVFVTVLCSPVSISDEPMFRQDTA